MRLKKTPKIGGKSEDAHTQGDGNLENLTNCTTGVRQWKPRFFLRFVQRSRGGNVKISLAKNKSLNVFKTLLFQEKKKKPLDSFCGKGFAVIVCT